MKQFVCFCVLYSQWAITDIDNNKVTIVGSQCFYSVVDKWLSCNVQQKQMNLLMKADQTNA